MKNTLYVGAALLIVVGVGVAWFFTKDSVSTRPAVQFGSSENIFGDDVGSAAPQAPREVPRECGQGAGESCVEYVSFHYRFSLFYPSSMQVQEFDEGGGAKTITFQNVEDAQGFQIFVVPYRESQVTDERFLQDVPSGVRENVEDITLAGATGAAFYSEHAALGETREVWIIHGGYLYEITTPRLLEATLEKILRTWQFT